MCGFLVFIFALAESPFTGQDTSRGLVVVLRRLKVSRGTIKADDFRTVIAKAVAVFLFSQVCQQWRSLCRRAFCVVMHYLRFMKMSTLTFSDVWISCFYICIEKIFTLRVIET